MRYGHNQISIPRWCNYKGYQKNLRSTRKSVFQFHVGAIIRYNKQSDDFARDDEFQFHVGAIIRPKGGHLDILTEGISIPRWCNYKYVLRYKLSIIGKIFQFHVGAIIRER